jgi:two-component system, OmpR family, response regulator
MHFGIHLREQRLAWEQEQCMGPKQIRVLVVDDHPDVAKSLGIVLELSGFEVSVCLDGRSALENSPHFQPDACILDIDLPEITGYELAKRLRKQVPNQIRQVIALTCLDNFISTNDFDLYFKKPANPLTIAKRIRENFNT